MKRKRTFKRRYPGLTESMGGWKLRIDEGAERKTDLGETRIRKCSDLGIKKHFAPATRVTSDKPLGYQLSPGTRCCRWGLRQQGKAGECSRLVGEARALGKRQAQERASQDHGVCVAVSHSPFHATRPALCLNHLAYFNLARCALICPFHKEEGKLHPKEIKWIQTRSSQSLCVS